MTQPEYVPSELELFQPKHLLHCIDDETILSFYPLNPLNDATIIQFHSPALNDVYKDLSWIYLRLKVQITKEDGTKWTTADTTQGHLVSNALHSIFKSCHVTLNGVIIPSTDQFYHIKEYIETTLNYTQDTATTRLSSQGYVPNSDGETLSTFSKNSVVYELYGRISTCVFDKLLIPGVSVDLKFTLESPEFYFVQSVTDEIRPAKLKIHDARLLIRHIKVGNFVRLAHEKLLMNNPIAYERKHGVIRTFNVPANSSNISVSHFYSGIRPSLIVFACVKNSSIVGVRSENPFNFGHTNLRSFNFLINGQSLPATPYDVHIDSEIKCYSHIFSSVFEGLGLHASDRSNLVTKTNFANDHFLVVQDLTRFNIGLSNIDEVLSNVVIGIEGKIATPLESTMTCILYMLLPSRLTIAWNREVRVEY